MKKKTKKIKEEPMTDEEHRKILLSAISFDCEIQNMMSTLVQEKIHPVLVLAGLMVALKAVERENFPGFLDGFKRTPKQIVDDLFSLRKEVCIISDLIHYKGGERLQ